MRVLAGIVGALLGIIIGSVAGLLFAFKVAGDLGGSFLCLVTVPTGLLAGCVLGPVSALRVLSYLRQPATSRKKQHKKVALVGSLLVGISVLVVGMGWAIVHDADPPSDQQLLINFSLHRAQFDRLATMVQADQGLTRVDGDWTQLDDPQKIGVSPARIAEYRRLLDHVGTPRGFQTAGAGDGIDFYYWLIGSATSSDTDKGYSYLPKPPPHLLRSLDECQPDERKGVEVYRHIEGNWYLFYEYLLG